MVQVSGLLTLAVSSSLLEDEARHAMIKCYRFLHKKATFAHAESYILNQIYETGYCANCTGSLGAIEDHT